MPWWRALEPYVVLCALLCPQFESQVCMPTMYLGGWVLPVCQMFLIYQLSESIKHTHIYSRLTWVCVSGVASVFSVMCMKPGVVACAFDFSTRESEEGESLGV